MENMVDRIKRLMAEEAETLGEREFSSMEDREVRREESRKKGRTPTPEEIEQARKAAKLLFNDVGNFYLKLCDEASAKYELSLEIIAAALARNLISFGLMSVIAASGKSREYFNEVHEKMMKMLLEALAKEE